MLESENGRERGGVKQKKKVRERESKGCENFPLVTPEKETLTRQKLKERLTKRKIERM